MGVRVLTLASPGEWDDSLTPWPASERDVYWTSAYHRAFEAEGGRATLFVFDSAGDRLVYPFLLRPIERVGDVAVGEGWQDVEGVYGFSGPLATTEARPFLQAAWSAFSEWAREQRVVAEFVRFNPLLGNERFRPVEMECSPVREHVTLDLRRTENEIWSGYTKNNRYVVRKAERQGLECRLGAASEMLDAFQELYNVTMDRNRASASYYFTREHFRSLAERVPLLACAALRAGEVVAVSLFLLAEPRIHYHLSGCSAEGLTAGANNLILHRVLLDARRRGLLLFHLGGGRTGAADDSLLRFKAAFSRGRAPASVGKRVHAPETYERLCALRRRQTPVPPSFFLAYRYEPPALAASRTA
jgi:hypothetical protein